MTDAEKKRKREDDKLKAAEIKKAKSNREKPKECSTKSNQFSEEEVKAILLSLFKGLDDKEACDEFFKTFNKSTRTKGAVRAKILKVREEFSNRINGITDKDQEKNGVLHLPLILFFFF